MGWQDSLLWVSGALAAICGLLCLLLAPREPRRRTNIFVDARSVHHCKGAAFMSRRPINPNGSQGTKCP